MYNFKKFALWWCLDDLNFKYIFHKHSGSEIKVKVGSGINNFGSTTLEISTYHESGNTYIFGGREEGGIWISDWYVNPWNSRDGHEQRFFESAIAIPQLEGSNSAIAIRQLFKEMFLRNSAIATFSNVRNLRASFPQFSAYFWQWNPVGVH
jgi:hypothetical protein